MTITASEALQRTIEHREIFHDEMLHLMRMIMGGEITPLMTAAILTPGCFSSASSISLGPMR